MTVIYVVEFQDFITGRIIQYGFALTEEEANKRCDELHKQKGGNRLDYWVNAYTCKDNEFTYFD